MNTRIGVQPDLVSYKGKKYLTTELTNVLSFNPKNKNKVCSKNVASHRVTKGHIMALAAVLLFIGGIVYNRITLPQRTTHQFKYILKELEKMTEESKQQMDTLPSDTIAMNTVI